MRKTQKVCLKIYIKPNLGKKKILKESSKIGKVASKNISLFLIVSAVQYLRKADAVVLKQ